jgi:ParB/RepB/Spo0J family partition protein
MNATTLSQAKPRMLKLAQLITLPQVRTAMDKAALIELAEDIRTNGLLSPILVRPAPDGKFRIIAGHRRAAAAQLAELAAVPALIRDADEDEALMMQLSENLHREDLSLQDTANAIRRIFDAYEDLDAVAAFVGKSKPWVSKHLALTAGDISWQARELLEQGHTSDLELLNIVTQVQRLGADEAVHLVSQIKGGTVTRESARDYLREAKARVKGREEEAAAKQKLREVQAKNKPKVFNPQYWISDAWFALLHQKHTVPELLGQMTPEQIDAISARLIDSWKDGEADADRATTQLETWSILQHYETSSKAGLMSAAYHAGVLGVAFISLKQFLEQLHDAMHVEAIAPATPKAAKK